MKDKQGLDSWGTIAKVEKKVLVFSTNKSRYDGSQYMDDQIVIEWYEEWLMDHKCGLDHIVEKVLSH